MSWVKRLLALPRRKRRVSAGPLDPVWYLRRYPDLAATLNTTKAVEAHYLHHGKSEGRYANQFEEEEADFRRYLVASKNFDLVAYRLLNPDLAAHFSQDRDYILHFIRHGRAERRPSVFEDEPEESRIWARMFNPAHYLAWTGAVIPRPTNRAETLAHFETYGMEQLAPINLDWRFDAAFYRRQYRVGAGLKDAALYRVWLNEGLPAGRAPNEEVLLRPWLGLQPFPDCFDWRGYGKSRALNPSMSRADVLIRLFEQEQSWRSVHPFLSFPKADLLTALASHRLRRGRAGEAAVILAEWELPDHAWSGAGWTLRGAVAEASGDSDRARVAYGHALASGERRDELLMRAVNLEVDGQRFEAARDIFIRHNDWMSRVEGEQLARALTDRWFAALSADCHAQLAAAETAADPAEAVDTAIRAMQLGLEQIVGVIEALEMTPAALGARIDGPVVLLGDESVRQCTHYRIEQKQEAFALAGIPLIRHSWDEVDAFVEALPGARAVIFYRVQATPPVIRAILAARRMGIPTWYEIDDLLFDLNAYPGPLSEYMDRLSLTEYRGLQFSVPLFRCALALCDRAIASTPFLLDRMSSHTLTGDGIVLPNALDSRSVGLLAAGHNRTPATGARVRVFYGSGTLAHSADFVTLIVPALERLMTTRAEVDCIFVGHVPDDPRLAAFGPRVMHLPVVGDIAEYWALLAACDIAIAVLQPSVVADCKSAIKWLEAAAAGIPTVASVTATFVSVIDDGRDGLLAATADEWFSKLDQLVADPRLRSRIGATARMKAMSEFGLDRIAKKVLDNFGDQSAGYSHDIARLDDRLRVLVCNVFLHPQSWGGATRVVEDNLAGIAAHSPDIALSALCSDEGALPGRLRTSTFGSVPVFRLGVHHAEDIDYRPFDDRNLPALRRILDLVCPHVVHIHCIQRLTASLVRECLLRDIPYIITIHDGWWFSRDQFFVDPDGFLQLPQSDLLAGATNGSRERADTSRRRALSSILAGASVITTVSESFALLCRDTGLDNVRVISNGLGKLPAEPTIADQTGPLRLGHIGGRSGHKGAYLIEAALRRGNYPNLSLLMVDGRLSQGETVRTIWGSSAVALIAPVPQAEVAGLYARFDVLLAPSCWPESFGLVAREAAHFGLWTVAPRFGAMADDLIEGTNGILIDTRDRADLDDALVMMNATPDHFRRGTTSSCGIGRLANDQAMEFAALYREIVDPALL
jgi:glycosyltransferase involved in cell wall biosynthesis